MRTLHFLSIIFAFSLLLFSCTKEGQKTENLKIPDGTYTGSFSVKYSSATKTGPVSLELSNGNFSCSGNYDRIPAGGSGTFSIEKDNITFIDKNFWTADFDWNLILNGKYKYSFDGKKLTISTEKNDIVQYKYTLEKL